MPEQPPEAACPLSLPAAVVDDLRHIKGTTPAEYWRLMGDDAGEGGAGPRRPRNAGPSVVIRETPARPVSLTPCVLLHF